VAAETAASTLERLNLGIAGRWCSSAVTERGSFLLLLVVVVVVVVVVVEVVVVVLLLILFLLVDRFRRANRNCRSSLRRMVVITNAAGLLLLLLRSSREAMGEEVLASRRREEEVERVVLVLAARRIFGLSPLAVTVMGSSDSSGSGSEITTVRAELAPAVQVVTQVVIACERSVWLKLPGAGRCRLGSWMQPSGFCIVGYMTAPNKKNNNNKQAGLLLFVLVSCLLDGQLVGTQEREGDPGLPRVDGIYTHLQRYTERNFCHALHCRGMPSLPPISGPY